jgi:hypothetical protein
VLWQVGLIGELGYRRQGYLNNHFSYFISWLEELYGSGYEVTHYIGARYPGTDPLIQVCRLAELHDPARQQDITGLSTFYIPPRDSVAMDQRTAVDLGILQPGQPVPSPGPPRRDVTSYGGREMAAFSSLARFRIPPSYHWQAETEAAKFLIELRFDPELQQLYQRDPREALADPRFAGLSDRERSLLVSRDSGSVQIAAKGSYRRSIPNEELIGSLLNSRESCQKIRTKLRGLTRAEGREALAKWLAAHGDQARRNGTVDWAMFASSLDFVYRNNLFPWTGVYADPEAGTTVAIVGHRTAREKSAVYVDGARIRRYRFSNGALNWPQGVMRLDLRPSAQRRVVLKTWDLGQDPGRGRTMLLPEANPARQAVAAAGGFGTDPSQLHGRYALRRIGRFSRTVFDLTIAPDGVRVGGTPVDAAVTGTSLTWTAGPGPCGEGTVTFVLEPIGGSVEFYGTTRSADDPGPVTCFGARLDDAPDAHKAQSVAPVPLLPPEAQRSLEAVIAAARHTGGLLLWHKWEKASFTNAVVNKYLARLV